MSFNGSGTFVINSAGQPVVANTVISATTFNALTADLANGLTTCITKDGQTTPTANIPMGGFKITNLATGTAATDAATVAQIQSNGAALVTVTGTDTLTGTLTPALVAYVTGAVYYFVAPATNTGAVTLNIDTLGAKAVTRDGTTALVAGDIVSGEMVAVVYDGTRFQLISAVNSFTNLNVSGTLTVAGTTTLNGNLQVGNAGSDTVNFQASGWTLTNNVSVIGTWADIGTITTADINGGTIDGTTIGGGTAAAGTFTTATATTGNITTVNATTVDSTNLEVTNLKAKDGTAAGSIADSTGVVTLNSLVATTADINGGTIDATTIGGSSPAAGNFTTVSAASMNAGVAAVTTLNVTSASAASINAAVALITTGTVTNLIATGASITSANIGNLQFTAASIASINAGVAVINNLTATSASIASMNGSVANITTVNATTVDATNVEVTNVKAKDGTAAIVINDLTGKVNATTVSAASVNAAVALITTGTVTNLTSTAASVASANVGVALITTGTITAFTATGASVASANVGTAVITGLTVTGASIASMNAGRIQATNASIASANAATAVITTGTVTNLTVTSASIASINAGVALVTTGTITNLTSTSASITSINAAVASITSMTEAGSPVVVQTDIGSAPNEVPLNQYLGALAYLDDVAPAIAVGTGITTGTGTICKTSAGLMGGVYSVRILIDLTGLNSGGTAGDIIGVNGTALPCYISLLPAITILGGRMTCLETPAGGDTDIDLYSATEGTGVEDQAITALTETQIINAGTQSAGTVTYFAADPAANTYLYLVGQSTSNATYTAGRFLIEIFGVQ
jgi:hypothetical protein